MSSALFEPAISANKRAANLRLRPHSYPDRLGFISTHFSSFTFFTGIAKWMGILCNICICNNVIPNLIIGFLEVYK